MESHSKSKVSVKHLPTYQGQTIRKSQIKNPKQQYLNRRVITQSSQKCIDTEMKKVIRQFKLPFKSASPKMKKNLTHKESITIFKKKNGHNYLKSPNHLRGHTQTGQIIKQKRPKDKKKIIDSSAKLDKRKSTEKKINQKPCKTKVNIHKPAILKTQCSFDSTSSCILGNDVQIIELIGQGTFGKVFKGRLKTTGQIVAIKRVLQDKKYKNRQVEIVNLLQGQFIMKVYGTYVTYDHGNQYLNIIMQYYDGDLYQRIKIEKKGLLDRDIKIYTYQIFRSLMYVHSIGICHRDIKPHNLLLKGMEIALCDFGSAKILNPSQSNLPYICSRCYRAPELIFGATHYTTMIDIWSVGCVILQMLNNTPLFIGQSSVDHLIEVIKIMGTPTKSQVIDMNPDYDLNDYKFPKIKKKQWSKIFPKAEPLLLDLISQIMIYSPMQRLNAAEALCHQYFDQLRQQKYYRKLEKQFLLPNFFCFREQQLKGHQHLIPKLIPSWTLLK